LEAFTKREIRNIMSRTFCTCGIKDNDFRTFQMHTRTLFCVLFVASTTLVVAQPSKTNPFPTRKGAFKIQPPTTVPTSTSWISDEFAELESEFGMGPLTKKKKKDTFDDGNGVDLKPKPPGDWDVKPLPGLGDSGMEPVPVIPKKDKDTFEPVPPIPGAKKDKDTFEPVPPIPGAKKDKDTFKPVPPIPGAKKDKDTFEPVPPIPGAKKDKDTFEPVPPIPGAKKDNGNPKPVPVLAIVDEKNGKSEDVVKLSPLKSVSKDKKPLPIPDIVKADEKNGEADGVVKLSPLPSVKKGSKPTKNLTTDGVVIPSIVDTNVSVEPVPVLIHDVVKLAPPPSVEKTMDDSIVGEATKTVDNTVTSVDVIVSGGDDTPTETKTVDNTDTSVDVIVSGDDDTPTETKTVDNTDTSVDVIVSGDDDTPTETKKPETTETNKPGVAIVAADTATDSSAETPPLVVKLGTAAEFVMIAKAGISSISSTITGDIGVSPIASTGITGFSLVADASGAFSTSAQLTGKAFAADYTTPSPAKMTTAVGDLETAYTDAMSRAVVNPANMNIGGGLVGGKTFIQGVYRWDTDMTFYSDIILSGNKDSVFIFVTTSNILATGSMIPLPDVPGGTSPLPSNVFFVSAGSLTVAPGAHLEGNFLLATNASFKTGSSLNGRVLAQTAITLDHTTIKSA
jgi:hypothetical protein